MPDSGRLRSQGARQRTQTSKRTIYVSQADRDVWEAADKFASKRGVSLASVVAEALARYLEPGAEQR